MRVSLGKIKMTIPEKDNRNGNNKKKQVPPRQPEGPVYVIIDGNNLVKYVFDLNHQPVLIEHDQAIINALTAWLSHQSQDCRIELCLDPRKEIPLSQENLSVFVVDHGKKADTLITKRLAFHAMQEARCVVITNDADLLDDLEENYWFEALSVFDFVLFRNKAGVYFHPLPASIKQCSFKENPIMSNASEPRNKSDKKTVSKQGANPRDPLVSIHQQTLKQRAQLELQPSALVEDQPPMEVLVRLILENWENKDARKFLSQSIRVEVYKKDQTLFDDEKADSRSLVTIFLEYLSEHPDCLNPNLTLINHVLLVLIQADGMQLTLSELSFRTGLTAARIKKKISTKKFIAVIR